MIDGGTSRTYDGIYCELYAAHEALTVTNYAAPCKSPTDRDIVFTYDDSGVAFITLTTVPPAGRLPASSLSAIKSVSASVTRHRHAPAI